MDEVEYRPKLSEIAWNLLTQVGRHSFPKLMITYIQRELSLWQLFRHAFLPPHIKTTSFYSISWKSLLNYMFMFVFEQPRVSLRCRKDNFKYWRLFSAATILDIVDIRTHQIHLVGQYICLLELHYLTLGFLSLALGKEPLEKDRLQRWIKPVD